MGNKSSIVVHAAAVNELSGTRSTMLPVGLQSGRLLFTPF
jgi:hypothetical protein